MLKGKQLYLGLIPAIILLDQLSKWLVQSNLAVYEKLPIIPGFFMLRHIRNSGAVWGLFSNASQPWIPLVITLFSLLALAAVTVFFLRMDNACRFELTAISFIIGGALGNILDRIFRGSVVDFLEFYIGRYHWPTFNAADSFITIGVILLIIGFFRGKCPSL